MSEREPLVPSYTARTTRARSEEKVLFSRQPSTQSRGSSMKRSLAIVMILATAACGKVEDKPYSVPGLLDMLKDKEPKARYTAVSHLGTYRAQAKEDVP